MALDAGLAFGKPVEVMRSQTGADFTPAALIKVFAVDPQKVPGYVGLPNARGGFSIYRVSKVTTPDKLDDAQIKLAGQRMGDQVGRELFTAYLAGLKAHTDVTINQSALEKKTEQQQP